MGAASRAITLALLVALSPADARADSCTGVTPSGGRFATCFDLGNRLSVTAGTHGFGGALALRHVVRFDDEPDLIWRLEHTLLEANHAGIESRWTATLYRGRYIRHARDGHIVLPLGSPPKKLFLPFDVGGFAEVGTVDWMPDTTLVRVGVVKVAGLVDVARSRDFRRRLAFGPLATWHVDIDRDARMLAEHIVAPFTAGLANLHLESATGRMLADLSLEAGMTWRGPTGWTMEAAAEASVERILLAVNDRPIALVAGLRYASEREETVARVGARIVLFDRRDPRVRSGPLPKPTPRSPPPAPAHTNSALPSPEPTPTPTSDALHRFQLSSATQPLPPP